MLFGVVTEVGRGMGVLNGGGNRRRKGTILAVNVGHPILTNGDFMVYLFSAMRGGDAALPKLLWDFLFSFTSSFVPHPVAQNPGDATGDD